MTRWDGTVRARLRAYRMTLVALATLTALVTGAVGGTFAFVEQTLTQSVQVAPELSSGATAVLRLDTRIAPDAAAQDLLARAVIGDTLAGAPVDVLRSVRTEPVTPQIGDENLIQVVLVADPALPAHAELTVGTWPDDAGQGAVHASAAALLGVDVGEQIVVGGALVTIVGLWEPTAPDSPFWAMDTLATGAGDEPPVVLVDETTLLTVQDDPFVRWSLLPRTSELTVDDTTAMAAGLTGVRGTLQASPAQVRGVVETGTLAATVARLDAEASTARSVTGVPIVVLLLISLVSVVQVARLLVAIRGRESQMLVARGASVPQLGLLAAAEAVPCAVGGALVGAGLSWVAVTAATPGGLTEAAWRWIVVSAAFLAVSVVAVLVTVVVLDARGLARLRAVDAAGRTRTVVGLGALVLLLAAAALSGWRVWLARGQEVPVAEELVVLAPGILLLTGALVALVVLAPTLRLVDRWAGRRRGLAPALPARQVSRRLAGYAVPAVLVALATGTLVLADTYDATRAGLQGQVDAVSAGADVRVLTGARGTVTPRTTVPAVDAGDAAQTSLVLNATGAIGDAEVRVLGVPGGRLDAVLPASGPGAASELGPLRGSAEGTLPGLVVPADVVELVVSVRGRAGAVPAEESLWYRSAVGGRPVRVATTLWLADTSGGLVQVAGPTASLPVVGEFTDAVLTELATVRADVPDGGPWRVVAVDVVVDKHDADVTFQVVVPAVTGTLASGDPVPLDAGADPGWTLEEDLVGSGLSSPRTGEVTVQVAESRDIDVTADLVYGLAAERVRLTVAGAGAGAGAGTDPGTGPDTGSERPTEVPALVTAGLLDRLDLEVGDTTDLRITGDRVSVRVVGELAVVPGGLDTLALAVDLDVLHAHGLRSRPAPVVANEIWIAVGTAASVADSAAQVAAAAPAGWTVVSAQSSPAGIAGSIGTAFWLAAVGAVALALAGTWSVLGALVRDRRGEVVALRSVGVTAAQQGRSRSLELAGIVVFALVAGLFAGTVVAGSVVGLFARISVPAAPAGLTQAVEVAAAPGALALGGLVLGAVLLGWAHARTVRRQALDLDHREDAQ